MSVYKPYKPVPLSRRCPHGYDKTECGTCVYARQSADEYAKRQREKQQAALAAAKELNYEH